MKGLPHIIVVAGPTASGKSDFAVELALKNNGEIISADSRQIYKGLDISTGKITKEEMKGVVHHMIDIRTPGDDFSVEEYRQLATPIIKDILARKKVPIICGGTGQYIDSLIFNTSIPKVGPNKSLRAILDKKSTDELHEELKTKDPIRAKTIDKHNRVRLIRALEIINTLGKVPTQEYSRVQYKVTMYLMSPTREALRKRITERLYKRLQQGMIDEVKNSMTQEHLRESIKKFGIEYVAIAKFLDGTSTQKEMEEEIITKSCQYAKRQETWNKKYKENKDIDIILIL